MQIGRRIYYDNQSGTPIFDTGERSGGVIPSSIERDIQAITALSERNRETFDVIELPFGANTKDFAEANGYRVNPLSKTIEFSYPVPGEPEAAPVYGAPLSEEVNSNMEYLIDVDFRLSMIEMGL